MPSYDKCNAESSGDSKGFTYRCNKKAGHKGEHADTKQFPSHYWRDATD